MKTRVSIQKLLSNLIFLMVLLGVSLPSAGTQPDPADWPLRIEISYNATQEKSQAQSFTLRYSIENTSDQVLYVLSWRTPLADELASNMFVVQRDGVDVPYIGKLVKRGPPQLEDYETIEPGQTIKTSFDLSQLYEMKETGDYTIQYQLTTGDILHFDQMQNKQTGSDAARTGYIRSNTLEATITVPISHTARFKAANFSGCSVNQQTTLNNAFTQSQVIADQAHQDLSNTPVNQRSDAPRYLEWFGVYNSGRYSSVLNNFSSISDALGEQQISFVCDCTSDAYAYVYPSVPYEIHLCNAFWNASLTGTDSQAGTIVHEVSHFNVVASTDDHQYGQAGCRVLADTNPSSAMANADSHEYFAENTPSLSMSTEPSTSSPDDLLLMVIPAIIASANQNQPEPPAQGDSPGLSKVKQLHGRWRYYVSDDDYESTNYYRFNSSTAKVSSDPSIFLINGHGSLFEDFSGNWCEGGLVGSYSTQYGEYLVLCDWGYPDYDSGSAYFFSNVGGSFSLTHYWFTPSTGEILNVPYSGNGQKLSSSYKAGKSISLTLEQQAALIADTKEAMSAQYRKLSMQQSTGDTEGEAARMEDIAYLQKVLAVMSR
ncbi:MAG: hypothetical protein GY726_04380 [Proteobacteria bacterium]|nr:hypothetical protein [Pseudomonadota bacterium]